MEDEVKTDFTWYDIVMLINLKEKSPKNSIMMSELANIIEISIYNPRFYKIMGYLLDNGIAIEDHRYGRTRLIRIDKKKLNRLIEEQDIINFLYEKYFIQNYLMDKKPFR